MRQLPTTDDQNLLVGSVLSDDAGVYRIDRDRALVQTVDFFTPIVDDPRTYGQIAAANALSDVFAMGGRPITALNLLGIPKDTVSEKTVVSILRGGAATAKRAKCTIVGGHTIRNPEPIYGLAVTGLVSQSRIITNAAARPEDLLVLTKPLGTGIVTTGIKRDRTTPYLAKKAITSMRHLNTVGAEVAERGLVRAGIDITGFGLLGHLRSMCQASGVGAEITSPRVPAIGMGVYKLMEEDCIPGGSRENQSTADAFTDWGNATDSEKVLLTDAQTSGGLLLCVSSRNLHRVLKILRKHRTPCATVIGRIVHSPKAEIQIL